MQRTQLVVAFLLGAVVALGAALIVTVGHASLPAAYAQGVSANNEILMTATTDTTNQNNTVYVMDSKSMRLAVYRVTGGKLVLGAVRHLMYDMKLSDYNGTPGPLSVSDIQKEAQKNEPQGGGKGK